MTTTTDLAAAVHRLDRAIAAGDVIRNEWTRTEDGRARVCLLATLAPACGVRKSAAACPASVLPAWLAECVPWIDDAGTEGAWPEMVRDFADLLRDSASASPEMWARLNLHWRRSSLAEAMAHTANLAVLGVSAEIAAMLDAELGGDAIDPEAWADVRADVRAVARASAPALEGALAAAGAARDSVRAPWAASSGAAWAAAAAAWAEAAASDRITAGFFAAWRAELDAQTTGGDRS